MKKIVVGLVTLQLPGCWQMMLLVLKCVAVNSRLQRY